MLKRVDTAAYDFIKSVDAGKPLTSYQVYDLKADGVGYSTSGGFVDDITDDIDGYAEQIISGDDQGSDHAVARHETGLGRRGSVRPRPVCLAIGREMPLWRLTPTARRAGRHREGFPGVVANHDVDVTIRPGTVHALVGENGAGKSTLMKILYGVQRPDEGTIRIGGTRGDLKSPTDAIARGVGMVFQHFMLADNLTVLENVVLGAEKLHGIGDEARAEIGRISDRFGFGLEPDVLVERLGVAAGSGSRSLKVLYRGARIIILDEPTAVLVPQEVDALFDNLRELKDAGPLGAVHLPQARRGARHRRRHHRHAPRHHGR